MSNFIRILVVAAGIACAGWAALDWSRYLAVRGIRIALDGSEKSPKATRVALEQFEERAERFSRDLGAVDAAVRGYDRLAKVATDGADRAGNLCGELSTLGRGIAAAPYTSYLLVAWANLRAVLGTFPCKRPYTEGVPSDVVDFAVRTAPQDLSAMLGGAMIELRASRKSEGARLVRRYLELGGLLPEREQRVVLRNIVTAPDVELFLPANFPVLFHWRNVVRAYGAERFETLAPGFDTLFTGALDDSLALARTEPGAAPTVREWLLRFQHEQPGSEVRKRADAALASMLIDEGAIHPGRYLRYRATLATVPVVRGIALRDVTPESRSLTYWGISDEVSLDGGALGVGAFVPAGSEVELLEFWNEGPELPDGLAESLRLFASTDNSRYDRIEAETETHRFGDRVVISMRFAPRREVYLKLAAPSGFRGASFSAPLASLIRAFGRTGEENAE